MGNEASSTAGTKKLRRLSEEVNDLKRTDKKAILREQNIRQSSTESDDSGVITTPTPVGIFIKRKASSAGGGGGSSRHRASSVCRNASMECIVQLRKAALSREHSSAENFSPGLLTPDQISSSADRERPLSAMRNGSDRRRSKSLCSAQMKADCQSLAASMNGIAGGSSQNPPGSARRTSNGLVPPLTQLRIKQCFKAARPTMGQMILKRACILRGELRSFIGHLPDELVDEMATELYTYISSCVDNIDDQDRVTALSRAFGEQHARLCALGFRPDYFAPIADAAIGECVKLDGGAHKRCETLLAWSQLMAAMFTGVRDGYYARVRIERRSSLPQHTRPLNKQNSFDIIAKAPQLNCIEAANE